METAAIRRALLAWFRREARPLPWRQTRNPYFIWLCEVIMQQTRIDQGLPYYERYAARYPTVRDLAAASEDDVLKLWEGLGYYTRARNMHRTARRIVEEYGGEFPRKAVLLQLLPGIGPYAAGAIASIAFGEAVPVVDGNVRRVLSRLFNLDACIDDPQTERELWRIAASLIPARSPGDFNQAIMELGATVCTPRKPECTQCPVASWCAARALGVQEQRPVRKRKSTPPHHEIVAAVIACDGRYLIGKRPAEGLLGGLWEFPGGKVRPGETHQDALVRECREELGVAVRPGGLIATVKHAYTHFRITLNAYRCSIAENRKIPVRSAAHTELRWVSPAEFDDYAFPKANHKFLHLLRGESELF